MTEPDPFADLPAARPQHVQPIRRRRLGDTAWIVGGVSVVAVIAVVLYWVLVFRQAG